MYRKPTHTDQYLQWDSHHNLPAKYSVISILSHIAKTVCSKPDLLNKEINHLQKALTKCKYPKWALDKVERKLSNAQKESREEDNNSLSDNTTRTDPNKEKYSNTLHTDTGRKYLEDLWQV